MTEAALDPDCCEVHADALATLQHKFTELSAAATIFMVGLAGFATALQDYRDEYHRVPR